MSGFLRIDSGKVKREASILDLTEAAAPSNTASVGKYYASSSDHKPHYVSNAGTNYDLTVDTRVDSGTAVGQMAYWDSNSWNHTETSELFWDDSNKRVGIGTASPGGVLGIKHANTYIDRDVSGNMTFTDGVTTVKTLAQLVSAGDLSFAGSSGTGSVDLDSQTFTIAGTTGEIETSAASQTVTIGLPSAVTITTSLAVTGGATIDANGVDLVTGNAYEINGTDVLSSTTLGSTVVNSSLTSVGTLTSLQVDNININGNTISSTAGTDLLITPLAGQDVVIDGHWQFDGATLAALTDANTTITAYAGKNITIESVTFDGGVCTATTFVGNLTGNVTGNTSGSSGSCTGNSATATLASTITVADESADTTCYPLFVTASTGSLGAKTAAGLTFNASTDVLSGTFSGNLTGNVTGNCSGQAGTVATVDSGTAAGQMAYWDGNSWNHTETTELYWYDTSKYLGLGTASPGYALEVSSSFASGLASAIGITKAYTSAVSPYLYFSKARGSVASKTNVVANDILMTIGAKAWINSGWLDAVQIIAEVVSTHTTYIASDITFSSRNASNVWGERMRITSTTRVGIGTSAPLVELQLQTSDLGTGWEDTDSSAGMAVVGADASVQLVSTDVGTWGSAIHFAQVDGTVYENTWSLGRQTNGEGDGDGSFQFLYGTDKRGLRNSSKLTLTSAGRLGLGTTDPNCTIHVAGTDLTSASVMVQRSGDADGPSIRLVGTRGNLTTPTASQNWDELGVLGFYGHNGTSIVAGAAMAGFASETWNGGRGASLYWSVTRNGETTPTASMYLNSDGTLKLVQISTPILTTDRFYNVAGDIYWDGVQLNVDSSTDSRLESGTAAGQMLFWDGSSSWDHTETSEIYWNDSTKLLGIGTASPAHKLSVVGSGATVPDASLTYYISSNAEPEFHFQKGRGTEGSPSSVVDNDFLGTLSASGYYNGVFYTGASIQFRATDNWGASARGAKIQFSTTPDGTTGADLAVTIDSSGFVGIGTDSYDVDHGLDVRGDSYYAAAVSVTRYGTTADGSYLFLRKARGTISTPTTPISGDTLGTIEVQGYYSGTFYEGCSLEFIAAENWGASARGTDMVFRTTENGTTGVVEVARLTDAGHFGIGENIPTAALNITGDYASGHCNIIIKGTTGTNAAACPLIYLHGARGTKASPSVNLNDDRLAVFAGGGYDGSNWAVNGYMAVWADATWTTSSRPTRLEFMTGQVGETYARLKMTIYGNGEIWMPYVYADSTSSPRTMYIQSNGKLGGISSTRRHKKNIKVMRDIDFLYDLRPVNFVFKKDAAQETQYGLIAEEVEKVNKDFVFYNDDKIAGVHYDRLISVLIKADQEQKKRGESMEKTIKSLTEKVTTLQNKLNKLSGKGTTNTKHKATAKYKADGKKRGTKC